MNHTNAEIVYLDFSLTSTKIAQRRARFRSLQNIIWVRSWIEDVRFLGLRLFHELQSTGVLHHLKNPSYGLNTLKDVLVEKGKMNLMVYARYGRTAVYHMQHLMKMINTHEKSEIKTELKSTKHILEVLPNDNWFYLNNFVYDLSHGDVGIYDLLLHKRDVSYSFETLFGWISNAGLQYVEFDDYFPRYLLKPQHVFRDDKMKKIQSNLSIQKALHACEIIQGQVIKHSFYASKTNDNIADIHDSSNVIYINGVVQGLREAIDKKSNYKKYGSHTFFRSKLSRREIIQHPSDFRTSTYDDNPSTIDDVTFSFESNDFTKFLVRRLFRFNGGVRLNNLFSDFKKALNSTLNEKELQILLDDFHESVKDSEVFLMKNYRILPFPKTNSLHFFKVRSI